MHTFFSKFISLLFIALLSSASMAQTWSPNTVRIVVPYPPGTEPDVLARDLGNLLNAQTGKTFVVDNKPGANSILGTDTVAKADGDGSTLLMVDRLAVVTNPMLYSKLPYEWEKALKPVSDLAGINLFLAVRDGLPVKNYKEFIEYAKANPKKVNVATGGNGHVTHIGMEMLSQANGVHFTYVPYKGVGPAVLDLAKGEVDAMIAGGLVFQPHVKAGKVRVIAVGDSQRQQAMPDVPTIIEAGGKAGTIPSTAFTLFAPSKVPDSVVKEMSDAVAKAMDKKSIRDSYAARGVNIQTTTPGQTLNLMKEDSDKYQKIIRDAGIKIE